MTQPQPNDKRWMSTGYLTSAPTGEIDHEQGIIRGVKVCTEGPAVGHGVSLDAEFVGSVVAFGNAKKQGVKARFGHPNMCGTALGTFLGRHKNFRTETTTRDDGSKAATAIADLFLSNEAKDTPNGDLHGYVLGMAENEPDVFGQSIVFTPGQPYRRDQDGNKVLRYTDEGDQNGAFNDAPGPDFAECAELHACDCVDDPAANDGLFSRFSGGTIAGQLTEFLDMNPQIWEAMQSNPGVLEALVKYGKNIDEFTARYTEYKQEQNAMSTTAKPDSEQPAKAPEALETNPAAEIAPVVVEAPEALEAVIDPPAVEQEPATIDTAEFSALVEEFGADVAAKVVLSGGGRNEALQLRVAELTAENETLKAAKPAGTPAARSEETPKAKQSIWKK